MDELDSQASRVRQFNRFYTRQIGVLNEGLLRSAYSLAEARLLYELAHQGQVTARELCEQLALDAGYVSRIVAGFRRKGLVTSSRPERDRRRHILTLSARGRREAAALEQRSSEEVRAMLARLSVSDRRVLVESMERVQGVLHGNPEASGHCTIRQHQPGDLGWIVERHGALYAHEYGWDSAFEALVGGIAADFLRNYDAKRERCWIAERNGVRVGSVCLVRKTERTAQLRLLLVEPTARGLGLGRQLVRECVRFASESGYTKIVLWTNAQLRAARHLYEDAGFRMVKQESRFAFGRDQVEQTWELALDGSRLHN